MYKVVDETVVKTPVPDLDCPAQEEADTKMVFHACHIDFDSDVTIRCSDADILIIMLSNMKHLKRKLKISILHGSGR